MRIFIIFALKYKIGIATKQHKFIQIKDLNKNGILIFLGTNPAPLTKIKEENIIEIKVVFILNSESKGLLHP
jgi:hypothetical protein